jgi:F-type H+-transporting ATPase subunit delta
LSSSKVARRYSKALVGLCDADNCHDQVASELQSMCDALSQSDEFTGFMTNPSIEASSRKAVLAEVAKKLNCSPLTTNFLQYLNDRVRLPELQGILEDFTIRLDERAGRVRATLTSAAELSASEVSTIKAQLEKTTGKTVVFETHVDPALLGGVKTQIGNVVLDGSLKTMLDRMRTDMMETLH